MMTTDELCLGEPLYTLSVVTVVEVSSCSDVVSLLCHCVGGGGGGVGLFCPFIFARVCVCVLVTLPSVHR